MKSNAILQSNLLDIIFENRNKDYGAYPLRKNYNRRLGNALSVMLAFVLVLSFLSFINKKQEATIMAKEIITHVEPLKLTPFKNDLKNLPAKIPNLKHAVTSHLAVNAPPAIVTDKIINKIVAAEQIEMPSNVITEISGVSSTSIVSGEGGADSLKITAPEIIKKDKLLPVENPEIMPQYPGGVNALLAFLRNNLHEPEDIEGDEVITVKIKFVINYNGKTESFKVLQSDGEIFDNEVIRVLKKMLPWIPGKSNGENVSVYYYLPVKFTAGL